MKNNELKELANLDIKTISIIDTKLNQAYLELNNEFIFVDEYFDYISQAYIELQNLIINSRIIRERIYRKEE